MFLGRVRLCLNSVWYWSLHCEWQQESARSQPIVEPDWKYLQGKYFSISDRKDTVSLACKGFASKPKSQLFFPLLRQGQHKGSSVPSGIHVTSLSCYSWCLANHTENFSRRLNKNKQTSFASSTAKNRKKRPSFHNRLLYSVFIFSGCFNLTLCLWATPGVQADEEPS